MNFESIDTDTLEVNRNELGELIGMLSAGHEINCSRLVIHTPQGDLAIDTLAMDLQISEVDADSDDGGA